MTFIMLDMICSPRDLALSSLLICNHYYLHHHLQFLLVGWDIFTLGWWKRWMQYRGKEKRWPMGTEVVLNTHKSHQKELLGYRLECVTQLEPGYKRSLSKSIRDTRGGGGSWFCAHSWHSPTRFSRIHEKENQSWEGALLTCCPASEQQLQADGAAAAVLRSLDSLGKWASGKANGEEAGMGSQHGRLHCTA